MLKFIHRQIWNVCRSSILIIFLDELNNFFIGRRTIAQRKSVHLPIFHEYCRWELINFKRMLNFSILLAKKSQKSIDQANLPIYYSNAGYAADLRSHFFKYLAHVPAFLAGGCEKHQKPGSVFMTIFHEIRKVCVIELDEF